MAEAPWRQAAAPPPPPGATGHIPSGRLQSTIPARGPDPPLCVQNAMLTKDKKPFTYTPGGIDLSEIRSPRMQKRLEMNAMNEGVGPLPQTQAHHPTGPLPPSALAAMQPQLSVQVFPTGGIPQHHHHGGPPAPPPPPKAPPMPMKSTSPLPTDALDRPDMTKIIPENPMALLRKTSGPVVKHNPMLGNILGNGMDSAPAPPTRQFEPPQSKMTSGLGSIYVPPVNQNATPPTPPQRHVQSPQFSNQAESPPANRVAPPYYKRQPSAQQQEPQTPPQAVPQRQSPATAAVAQREPQAPDSPKATLSKAPTPWLQKRQSSQETPEWAVKDNRGHTSPPVEEQFQQKAQVQDTPQKQPRPWQQQQQQQPPWQQQQQQQPQPQQQQQQQQPPWRQANQQQLQQAPEPPQQNQQQQRAPETQPWQQQQKQQPEVQPWQQRQQQPEPANWQQRQAAQPEPQPWQQNKPVQSPPVHSPQGGGVRKQVQNREQPQESGPMQRTEVVVVNEPPQVFHHPGAGHQQRIIVRQQQPQQNNFQQQQPQPQQRGPQGARIIPIQVDGASSNGQVRTPGTPGSSNRVLQKITQTDGDDDDDQPVTEHSPRTPQNFPQRQLSTEQIRKIKQNEGDQELMNKFKQVPQNQQNNNRGPKVRTIPIQIEGDGPTKTYVPPSEQTVPEPKKYMGSSIPSRSFKILQAMTAPDDCGPGQSDL